MEVLILKNAFQVAEKGAELVSTFLQENPRSVLGLATGSTPVEMYKILVAKHHAGELTFRDVISFNLDEYVGLGPKHPCSYHQYMAKNFFDHVDIPSRQIHIPDGLTQNIPAFCRKYEGEIRKAGGIDLQVLGIGHDGHIGFNEPSSSLSSRTRIKTLTRRTVELNKRFFPKSDLIPHHVITMGVGTILNARCCLLLAYGKNKAAAIAKMVEGPIAAMVPASALQLHPKTMIVIDQAAASRLQLREYYKKVYENKPEWQRYE